LVARDLIPASLRPVARGVYHPLYRAGLRLQFLWHDLAEQNKPHPRPLPPTKLRFRVGENVHAENFLETGRRSAAALREIFERIGFVLEPGKRVLDLGCGCGRTLTWLVGEFPEVQWHGCDVDAEAIAWVRANLSGVTASVNNPLPPLPYADSSFDLLYGISVFTHLDLDYQRQWIAEFARVLKPGGMALMTFHSPSVWRNTEFATQIERDGFAFVASKKLDGILPGWYHTAFQMPEHLSREMSQYFARVERIEGAFGAHDAVVAWKP
jgi:cyclopropane fatty-acyl-phospholipid synthase-like methyltransferase